MALLNIARLRKEKETLNNEINDNVSDRPIQLRHIHILSSSMSALLNWCSLYSLQGSFELESSISIKVVDELYHLIQSRLNIFIVSPVCQPSMPVATWHYM